MRGWGLGIKLRLGYEPSLSLSLSLSAGTEAAAVNLDSLPIPTKPPKKKKDPKKLRAGGGKVWEDSTLDDWDPSRCLDNRISSLGNVSLVPRPFLPPVFDHLQKRRGKAWEGESCA